MVGVGREGHAVNQGTDGFPVGLRIHDDGRGGVRDRGCVAGNQCNVVNVKGRELRPASALDPKTVHVRLAADAKSGQGHGDLLPGTGWQRGKGDGNLCSAIERGLHLQRLPSAGAAVNPESQVGVRGRIKSGVMHIEGLVGGTAHADGIQA